MTAKEQAAIQQAVEALEKLLPWALQAGANAEDALADLRALGDGWQEIATAPRNGESVMGLHGYGPIEMSFLDRSYGREAGWYRYTGISWELMSRDPGYWQPLPVPPGGKR